MFNEQGCHIQPSLPSIASQHFHAAGGIGGIFRRSRLTLINSHGDPSTIREVAPARIVSALVRRHFSLDSFQVAGPVTLQFGIA
jgi:hypothetical protein